MRKVLVVEDDPILAHLTTYVLERAGFTVLTSADGRGGMATIEEHRPRVVVLDLTLPDIRGDDLCQSVRRNPDLRDTYMVVVSARDVSECARRASEAGADAWLPKPCDPDDLVAAVERGFALADGASSASS